MPVGMETDIQIKASNGQVSVDKAEGIVECFVAAIGNKDSVGDIIQPGAFASSLMRRKPRVVWGHNWNDPIGKVLDIQEVGPSDPRLPEKMKAGGVGGLYARVQFNLGSEKGREAFASVAFFGPDQEWSIGYKTINATFDPVRQANILREVELYECSPVLHGANQLTGTISVKGADVALMEHEETHVQMQDDLEFSFDDFDEKMCGLPHPPGQTDQHDRKLELELMSRSPQPIKLISASDGVAIFQVQRSDDGPAVFQIHYHHHPERGFLLGRPERVVPQMVYAPVKPPHKPPTIRMKPQVNPIERYRHDPNDMIMPRIMRVVQKLDDSDEKELSQDELIISCRLEDAFATKSLLDPIIDYHGAIAEVTEEGIIIKSGATPDFIEAVETATKALGRRLGRGLPRGGGGGSGKVRRAGRALQRFDPNAIDADMDMVVQEGTPWERPALPRKPDLPDLPRSRRTRFDAERRKPGRGLRSVRTPVRGEVDGKPLLRDYTVEYLDEKFPGLIDKYFPAIVKAAERIKANFHRERNERRGIGQRGYRGTHADPREVSDDTVLRKMAANLIFDMIVQAQGETFSEGDDPSYRPESRTRRFGPQMYIGSLDDQPGGQPGKDVPPGWAAARGAGRGSEKVTAEAQRILGDVEEMKRLAEDYPELFAVVEWTNTTDVVGNPRPEAEYLTLAMRTGIKFTEYPADASRSAVEIHVPTETPWPRDNPPAPNTGDEIADKISLEIMLDAEGGMTRLLPEIMGDEPAFAIEAGWDILARQDQRTPGWEYIEPPSEETMALVKKYLYERTQEFLADFPDVVEVYRFGGLDRPSDDTVPISFSINPRYQALEVTEDPLRPDLVVNRGQARDPLPWARSGVRRGDAFHKYTVRKEDIRLALDLRALEAIGEDEVQIMVDDVTHVGLADPVSLPGEEVGRMIGSGRPAEPDTPPSDWISRSQMQDAAVREVLGEEAWGELSFEERQALTTTPNWDLVWEELADELTTESATVRQGLASRGPEGVGMADQLPSKQRIGDMSRSQYEAFRTAEAEKIIKAYGIEDVSDPLYPHPALTHFSHFDHTELVPMSFFEDMPGNRNNDGSAARAGEMRDFELGAPIIMEKLDELTEDIRANGIKEALIVRYNPETGDMHLDEGNHRLLAAERLGLQTVPVRMLRGTEDRRGIAGPRKQIERARTNVRDEALDVRGEYLGESFRPSSVKVPTEKTSPEMRRLQMMVSARGGSSAQAKRRERRGLGSRTTRYDLRAREVADPKRLDGAGRRRSGGRGEVRAGDTPIWDRQKQWNRETRRVASLRSSGYNENEIASVMDPPRRTGGGLASRNFNNQSAHDNLRELVQLRGQLQNFLEEHPDFNPHLPELDDAGVARVGTVDVSDMPDEWHELMDEFDELHTEYGDLLDLFRTENEALGDVYEKRLEIEGELRGLDKDLKSEISQLDELSPVTDDRIREFLEADDLDGFMALFTPEYLAERNSGTREGDTFYDLEATEENWYNWEYEVRAAWRSAQDARTDIQDAEQRHYGAEQTITQHLENGDSEVLEAVELLNGLPLDTRASMKGEAEEQSLAYDPPAISPSSDRGLSSQNGRGLGEDREIDTRGSSAVSHLRHDGGREELVVSFRNGETYVYGGVDSRMADRIEEASSIGRAINDLKADADYVIKPDGTVDGLAPTLSSRIEKHKRRLDGTRGLTKEERDLFDLADGGAGQRPIRDPGERTRTIKDLHGLADNLAGDGEPAAAAILRDAAAAIRSDPRRRVNAHHSGKVELTLTDDEIGEISNGLRSAVSKHSGSPNIERGLTLYDRKLSDAKGGKVTFDTAEYNSILEAHARLELLSPDDTFKPGRDVLELAASSKKGKWESPNLARAQQRPDLPVGFASRRPNNGAPQDITPRLQGDLVYWARQQGGFRVVQELVRRYDRDREQLSPRDWIRLHDYYANHSPAGRGMPLRGERRGLRSQQGEKPRQRAEGAGRKVGSGVGDKFVGRRWDEVRPSDWNEMSLDEQSEELITNHSPNRDTGIPKSEQLRQVDYDRITEEIRLKQQASAERSNPELRRERQMEERAARRAERIALAREKGTAARPVDEDKKASQEKRAADNAVVAMERRKKVITALNRLVGRRRDGVSKAVIDDRADPTHGEFWDSMQDMLATAEDGDFKFSLIEGLAQRVDDYLEDSTGADLTDDENDSLTFAVTLRNQLGDILEEYEADEFINRGDVVPEDEGVIRPVGPQGDDPDDPTGATRVSREYDIETTQQQRLRPGLASRESQRTERGVAYEPIKEQALGNIAEGLRGAFEAAEQREVAKKKPAPKRERPTIPMKKPEAEDVEGPEGLASRSDRVEARDTRRLAASKERGAKARTRRATQRQKQKEKYVADLGKRYRENRQKEPDEGVMGQLRPITTPWTNQRVNELILGNPPDAENERQGLASRSERTPFDGQSSFFKIVYDSLGKEIREAEKDDDSSTAGSLKKLKKNFEYFDKRSIKYGPKHPKQTDSGTVEIDNEDLPDIIDALFRALDRQMRIVKGSETSGEREDALLDYLSAIINSAGVDPEMETLEPIRIAAISKFIEMLSHGAMDLL